MAVPASKKRKTKHLDSSDDEDVAFFTASGAGGANEEEPGDEQSSAGSDEEMRIDSEIGHDQSDSDEERSEGNDNRAGDGRSPFGPRSTGRTNHDRQITTKTKSLQSSASAYAHNTFKSSIFKLKVDELLSNIRPKKTKREVATESALHALKQSIEQIPPRAPTSLNDAERDLIKQKVAIPFPAVRPPKDVKYRFAYAKPAMINVVGSFALKTASRSRDMVEVDMVVIMPKSLFEEKDYLNYRYFHKRAYYLACIAAGLKAFHKSDYSYHFKLFHDDPLKPILVIEPAPQMNGSAEQVHTPVWRINVIPCVGEDQFPANKLRPEKNCIRNPTAEGIPQPSTAFYNSSLRSDMLVMPYLKLVHGAAKSCEAFGDACLLGSTWLRQRGFTSSVAAGGFGNFAWAALLALCLQSGGAEGKPLLSSGYSSYQMFKATLQLLAMRDFTKQPLVFGSTVDVPNYEDGTPMVWDASRSHNVFFKVPQWSYLLMRHEAKSSVAALSDQLSDGFETTFILRVQDPLYRYDHVVSIPTKSLRSAPSTNESASERLQRLFLVLQQGLKDRVTLIDVITEPHGPWDLGASQPKEALKGIIKVGLRVNPDTVKRTVDHGPSAEHKSEAAAFRQFWGEKSELRRFKDGSILESLVWASPQESGQSVLEQIVRYLLGKYFGLVTTEELSFFGDDVSQLVRGGSDRMAFEGFMARYQQFESDIRGLDDLPLSIRQIMPADPQLRYASNRPAMGGKILQKSVPADVVLQFEGSGRWPDDLVAIQRTKIAFLLKLADSLSASVDTITARIGLENDGQEILNQGFLDVTYDSDVTFRVRIYHDREATLLERRLKDKSVDPKSREVSAAGLAKYKRDYVKSPSHTQAIARLCVRHPALSGSIRLTKRWFTCHLLSNHISDEVIELLVVKVFTQPWPWQTPSSVQTGFLRTLFWISRWDWKTEPLIVNLNTDTELKRAELQSTTTNFQAWRKLDPGMNRVVLFAASSADPDGTTWTDGRPAKVVAGRMTGLAKAACAEISEKQLKLDPTTLFSSPLEDFDFALHLVSEDKKGRKAPNGLAYRNLELEAANALDMIGYDPAQGFLNELEALFGSFVVFFYGGIELPVIAGLWSPLATQRSWKVNLAYSTIPIQGANGEDDVQATINKSAVLNEITKLGGDLIANVEMFTK